MDPISIALGLAQFAPMIAGWLGGSKAQDVATKVVSVAESVTGQKGNDALAAIQADPNLAVQFQTKVFEQQITLAQIAADVQKSETAADLTKVQADVADRDSARKREESVRDWMPGILATSVTIGFFGLLAFMLKYDVPENNRDVLNIMLGSLGTAWLSIITYYFGSSLSSAKKDAVISTAMQK